MGYFYWLRAKNSNHLRTELSLGYLKDAKFYVESRASFIDISCIASFKLFLIAWLRKYYTFLDSSVVSLKSSPCRNTPSWELFSEKKILFYYQTFFLLQICSLLDCSLQIPEKILGSPSSFKWKGEFLSPLSLVWGKSVTFCDEHALMCAR